MASRLCSVDSVEPILIPFDMLAVKFFFFRSVGLVKLCAKGIRAYFLLIAQRPLPACMTLVSKVFAKDGSDADTLQVYRIIFLFVFYVFILIFFWSWWLRWIVHFHRYCRASFIAWA